MSMSFVGPFRGNGKRRLKEIRKEGSKELLSFVWQMGLRLWLSFRLWNFL